MSVNGVSSTPFWSDWYCKSDAIPDLNDRARRFAPLFNPKKPWEIQGLEIEKKEEVNPENNEEAEAAEKQKTVEHTVKKGENVWDIAAKYLKEYNDGQKPKPAEVQKFTKEIMDLNELEFDNTRTPKNWFVMIKPGQVLLIPAKPEPEQEEEENVTPEPTPLTEEEIADAQESGSHIAGYLTNMWTTDGDQKHVKNIIQGRVNDRNVLEVIRGYEEGKRFSGDSFFEQLVSEWSFDEKKDLIVDVAQKLKAFLEANNMQELADKIEIKDTKDIDREYAKQLDVIVKQSFAAYDKNNK